MSGRAGRSPVSQFHPSPITIFFLKSLDYVVQDQCISRGDVFATTSFTMFKYIRSEHGLIYFKLATDPPLAASQDAADRLYHCLQPISNAGVLSSGVIGPSLRLRSSCPPPCWLLSVRFLPKTALCFQGAVHAIGYATNSMSAGSSGIPSRWTAPNNAFFQDLNLPRIATRSDCPCPGS